MSNTSVHTLIENKLREKFPDKKFEILPEIDIRTYQPNMVLSVNGRRTHWQYEAASITGLILSFGEGYVEQFATNFVNGVQGLDQFLKGA